MGRLPMGRPSRWVALPMGRSSDGSPFRWVALSASQPGPSEREAENASRPPLPCAAPRRTALAGSHHSPWWGNKASRRRGEKVGRSAGARDQYWSSLWAGKPGRPGRNRGRSHAVGRQELLRRVHKLSMVSCGKIRASLYLLVVLCNFFACHLCFQVLQSILARRRSVRGAHRPLQTPDLTTREGPTDQTPN